MFCFDDEDEHDDEDEADDDMNPDNPSREEMEAKLTALLLGELSEEEAQLLRWAISQSPALARLHEQLKRTIGIVREVSVKPAESDSAQGTPLKLSDERRKKLLAHFQTPRPKVKELSWLKRIEIRPLVPVLVAFALIVVLATLMLPALSAAKSKARRVTPMSGMPVKLAKTEPEAADKKTTDSSDDLAENKPADFGQALTAPHALDGGAPAVAARMAVRHGEQVAPVTMMPAPPPKTDIVLPKAEETATFTFDGGVANSALSRTTVSGYVDTSKTETPAPVVNLGAGYKLSAGTLNFGNANTYAENVAGSSDLIVPGNGTAAVHAAPATPSVPSRPNAAVGPGGVVEDGWDVSGNSSWTASLQPPDSAGKAIAGNQRYADINGIDQTQVAKADAAPAGRLSGISGDFGSGGAAGVTGGGGRGGAGRAGGRGGRGAGGPGGGSGMGGGMGGGSGFGGASPVASAPQANFNGVINDHGTYVAGQIAGRVDGLGVAEPAAGASPGEHKFAADESSLATLQKDYQSSYSQLTGPATARGSRLADNSMDFDGDAVVNAQDQTRFYQTRESGANAEQNQALGYQWYLGNSQTGTVGANGGESENRKVPVLGDMPVAGNLFIGGDGIVTASTTAPAPSEQPVRHIAAGADLKGFYDDSYTTANSADVWQAGGLTKSGSGTLTMNGGALTVSGNNTYSGGTVVNNGALVVNGEGTLGLSSNNKYSGGNTITGGTLAVPLQPNPGDVIKTFHLENASPTDVANEVASLFPSTTYGPGFQVAGGRGGGGGDTASQRPQKGQLNVVADPRLSAVVVSGPQDTMNQVTELMKQLDVPSERDQEHYVATLKNADPNQVAQVLQNMFGSSTARSSGNQNSALMQRSMSTIGGGGGGGGGGGAAGIPGGTQIQVDPLTHDLIVVADKETEKQIDKVLKSLDGPDVKLAASESPNLATRTFKVDPNTFYEGLQNVATTTFGSGKSLSSSQPQSNSAAAQTYFNAIGVNLAAPGKNLTYDEKTGTLVVKATPGELGTIDRTVQILNQLAAQKKAADIPLQKAPEPASIPQPEILTSTNAFSTFSMNVSDVSYKLAEASLQKGRMPDAASIRSEEFINAFDYRDPEAAAGRPVAFVSERARYPFAQNRDLLRFSIKTAASGRAANRPMNLVLLLDTSGSMERADRVAIIREALRVLAAKLRPQDTVSVVTFSRVARLWADGVPGSQAGEVLSRVGGITPEGGTNLEEAMNLAYQTALRHYLANGANRVVLLTDGAANLGNVNPDALKLKVESFRKQGIALDCFGIGWEDYDDSMLAELSGNGDGRYAFINTPEEASTEFAAKLAGALQVAAQDVKVQVEFNPQRVTSWRQIGYAKHQLTKEQFRDNTVLAAEVAAQEAGNALYTVEIKPDGIGPVATVYARYKIPGTMTVEEHSWTVGYDGNVPALEQSSPAMRLAGTASAFSEWLAGSAFAQEVTTDELLRDLSGVPQIYGADQRPKQLEWMIRQAKSLSGR